MPHIMFRRHAYLPNTAHWFVSVTTACNVSQSRYSTYVTDDRWCNVDGYWLTRRLTVMQN